MSNSNVPANLRELMQGDQEGYELREGFFLELEHTLMGFFPAIFRETERVVVILDPKLLTRVLQTLTPRKFRIHSNLFYVNQVLGIAFSMSGKIDHDEEESEPQRILSDEEFDQLITKNPHPFKWAPGLVSNDMSREEFLRTLEVVAEEHGVELPA